MMKKNILSAILMSTVILSAVAPISGVNADANSDIAKQDATISSAPHKLRLRHKLIAFNQKLILFKQNKLI